MKKLRIGVAGLGRAFAAMAPAFRDPRVALAAGADPRPEAMERFRRDHGGRGYATVEALCADPGVDVIYVATPHQFHAAHACLAASSGKHVLVEKPMALSLEECRSMIEAARAAGVTMVVGHSHSFDSPILKTKSLIESRAYGPVRMISALNYTDFLYRPRRAEELDTAQGGGVFFNQAAHQVDVVRLLGGGRVRSVKAAAGAWDAARPTEGAYACLLGFEGGAFAQLTYSGYAHFDSDEFMGWIGEMGQRKDPADYGTARKRLKGKQQGNELALKRARNYGGKAFKPVKAAHHQHFGVLIVSCEKADLRPLPGGVMVYADGAKKLVRLPKARLPRVEVIDELCAAVAAGKPPLHGGEWAMATLRVCLAMLESARRGTEILL